MASNISVYSNRKPVKYLTNKELLAEIARCKKTFCSFTDEQYSDFDGIVHNLDEVTEEFLEIICAKKSKELTPKGGPVVTVEPNGLVIRLMTYDHIPLDPDRKRKSRAANQTHAMTSFPPFKHMLLTVDDDGAITFTEVGRSHWSGDFTTGHFTPEKGRVSNRMGKMYMMLVDRYARRGNWRGYCCDTQTEALTKRGWLKYDEITEADTILSYNDGKLVWSRIEEIYRGHYEGKMFHLTAAGLDAFVTPHHKFVTDSGLKEAEFLLQKDKLVLIGEALENTEAVYEDAFVELVGWAVTEGSYHKTSIRNYTRIGIYQNEGTYADRIRTCISALGAKHSEYHRDKQVRFDLQKDLCLRILEVAADRVPSMEFISALTTTQREILLNTMLDGDGWRTQQGVTLKRGYTQKCRKHVDAFVALCTLNGIRTSVKARDITSFGEKTSVFTVTLFNKRRNVSRIENINMHGAKTGGTIKGRGKSCHPNEPTVPYSGTVWCPRTEYGSFMCRRGDYVFLSGNTYVDEMKSLALMQLSQVGLQFDESKSSNPFAFYTTTISNCFTRIQNLEKKNQNIRDDLLISMGAAPSYTRQIENELTQNGSIEPTPIPMRRGRKTAAQISAAKEANKPIE